MTKNTALKAVPKEEVEEIPIALRTWEQLTGRVKVLPPPARVIYDFPKALAENKPKKSLWKRMIDLSKK